MCVFWIRKGIYNMLPVDVLAPSCVCDTNLSGDYVYPTHGDHNGDHSGWGDLAKNSVTRETNSYYRVSSTVLMGELRKTCWVALVSFYRFCSLNFCYTGLGLVYLV